MTLAACPALYFCSIKTLFKKGATCCQALDSTPSLHQTPTEVKKPVFQQKFQVGWEVRRNQHKGTCVASRMNSGPAAICHRGTRYSIAPVHLPLLILEVFSRDIYQVYSVSDLYRFLVNTSYEHWHTFCGCLNFKDPAVDFPKQIVIR